MTPPKNDSQYERGHTAATLEALAQRLDDLHEAWQLGREENNTAHREIFLRLNGLPCIDQATRITRLQERAAGSRLWIIALWSLIVGSYGFTLTVLLLALTKKSP